MGNPPISATEAQKTCRTIAAFLETGEYYYDPQKREPGQKSAVQAAQEPLGIRHSAIWSRLETIANVYGWTPGDFVGLKAPDEEGDLPPFEEVYQRHAEANARYIEQRRNGWQRAFVVPKAPFGVFFCGDPHGDNKGCNLIQLRRDMETAAVSKMYGVSMGDILDNFDAAGPKLAPKQAQNRMSKDEGFSFLRWYLSFPLWRAHILGNHDKWLGEHGQHLIAEWANNVKVFDWMARLIFKWDDGHFRFLAAHDFAGHSQYNPLHGLIKRAMQDGTDDAYIAAHRHNFAKGDFPNGHRERHYWFARTKGYKDFDEYAHQKGFEQQTEGHSVVAVINPFSETRLGRCHMFGDVSEGAEYLNYLRNK